MLTLRIVSIISSRFLHLQIIPVQESQPVQKDQERNHMEIDAREQLPLRRMRRTWDATRIFIVWIACVGFIRSRVVLYVLYIGVGRGRTLLTLPEPPAHLVCLPTTMALALRVWMNLGREARVTSDLNLGLKFDVVNGCFSFWV